MPFTAAERREARELQDLWYASAVPITLERITGGTYDPSTGSPAGGSAVPAGIVAVVDIFDTGEAGQIVQTPDRRVRIPAKELAGQAAPTSGDRVITPDGTLNLTDVRRRTYAGILVGFECRAAR